MNKLEARIYLKQTIKDIPFKKEKSLNVSQKLLGILKVYNVIGLYAAMDDEINLDFLIINLLKEGKIVVLPKIEGEDINFYQIKSLDELVISSGKYQIREPKPIELFDKKDIDVILVPGLGFDKENNRLGRGKGYYDRYLKNYCGMTIGVGFAEQIVDKLPTDENDIKVKLMVY